MANTNSTGHPEFWSAEDVTPAQTGHLHALSPGETGDCFVLLSQIDRGKTRDSKPYFRVTFRDQARTATAMIWHDTTWFSQCEQNWKPGQFFKVRCRYLENQYGSQIEIEKIRSVTDADKADGFDATEFYQRTQFDIEEMYRELFDMAGEQIEDVPLRNLVLEILDDHKAEIQQYPAAVRNHHACIGGLLEHVLSVTRTALFLADKYRNLYPDLQPPLSKSLIVAGAILHDIGKLQELKFQPEGAEYTAQGRLVGHILLGRDLIREKAASLPEMDPEILLRLEHIIISHQNLPEWGSPVAPHTPEALLVYFADDIDAKFQMMATALQDESLAAAAEFTGRTNALRRPIFRGLAE